MSVFSGPGYFVCKNGDGEHEGEIAIDYTHLPKSKPDSWPGIRGNEGGLAGLVYGGMVDYLRRVAQDVFIGSAHRGGKETGNYFVLSR
jgi:hypothetical protein